MAHRVRLFDAAWGPVFGDHHGYAGRGIDDVSLTMNRSWRLAAVPTPSTRSGSRPADGRRFADRKQPEWLRACFRIVAQGPGYLGGPSNEH